MPDNRKERERAELHRAIWNVANNLRESVDDWYFKQYVLGLLFYRYISENLADYINAGEREAKREKVDIKALNIKTDQTGKRKNILRKETNAIIAETEEDIA
jgi:type I restriction enzyme M protein